MGGRIQRLAIRFYPYHRLRVIRFLIAAYRKFGSLADGRFVIIGAQLVGHVQIPARLQGNRGWCAAGLDQGVGDKFVGIVVQQPQFFYSHCCRPGIARTELRYAIGVELAVFVVKLSVFVATCRRVGDIRQRRGQLGIRLLRFVIAAAEAEGGDVMPLHQRYQPGVRYQVRLHRAVFAQYPLLVVHMQLELSCDTNVHNAPS